MSTYTVHPSWIASRERNSELKSSKLFTDEDDEPMEYISIGSLDRFGSDSDGVSISLLVVVCGWWYVEDGPVELEIVGCGLR